MAVGGYRFLAIPTEKVISGDYLYLHPNEVTPSQTLTDVSASHTFSWSYNGDSGSLSYSSFKWNGPYQNSNPVQSSLIFSTDTEITYSNAKYQYLCILQYHETDSTKRVTNGTNFATVTIPYDSAGAWYFFTKIYKKYDTYKTITFDPNGGTVSPTYTTAWGGDFITLPTPTYDSSHVFMGWYRGSTRVGEGGDTWTVPTGTSNITLVAKWKTIDSGNLTWTTPDGVIYAIGTWSYEETDGNLSLSWNVTIPSFWHNGKTYTFDHIRISYIPSSQWTWVYWNSSQTSGTFDNSSVTQGISALDTPPRVYMYWHLDSLLYVASDALAHVSGGALAYGPKAIG